MTEETLNKWTDKMKQLKKDYEGNAVRIEQLREKFAEMLDSSNRSKVGIVGSEIIDLEHKNETILEAIFEEMGEQKPYGLLIDFLSCQDEEEMDRLLECAVFVYFAGPGAECLPAHE